MRKTSREISLAFDTRPTRMKGTKAAALAQAAVTTAFIPEDDAFVVHDEYQSPTMGRVLHAQQYFRGFRVYRGARVIRIAEGETKATPQLYWIPASTSTRVRVHPAGALECAVRFLQRRKAVRAATRLRVSSETRFSELIGTPTIITASTIFAEPVRLRLEVFADSGGGAEIGWVLQGALKNGTTFECVVAAGSKRPKVLFCFQTNICAAFQASWVRFPLENAQRIDCPMPPIATASGAPGQPSVWHLGGPKAEGPNASCHPGGNSKVEALGSAKVDTPFVWCNLARDFFHEFGFEGELYGFEGDDPLWTRRYTKSLELGAECKVDSDGYPVRLDFYGSPYGGHHAATDPGIVIHEYTHAVTNRLLGGAAFSNPFYSTEGKGLDEGYSDYFALTVLDYLRRRTPGLASSRVIGAGFKPVAGLRDYTAFAGVWTGALTDQYEIGKVWCAALLGARDEIATRVGGDDADRFMWRALIMSLKVMLPISPAADRLTLAHAKDALVSAASSLAAGGGPIANAPGDIQTALNRRQL